MRTIIFSFYIFIAFAARSQDVFEAVRSGNLELLDLMYRQNRDTINVKNSDGFTPLIIAVYRSNNQVVETLIAKGADIEANSPEGTALHAACYTANYDAASFLLRAGSDVNASTEDRTTPLHYAVATNNEALIELMVKSGANPLAADKEGIRPVDLANSKQIKKLLK